MKVEIKELQALTRELSVEVPAETVNSKMEEMFQDVRRKVTLKGFRKGKAPINMIRSLYHDDVKADVAEEIIKVTYPAAIREKTLKVASHPTVTDLGFQDDGGFKYTATVEVFPEIEKVNYDELKLDDHEPTVTDQEVDEIVGFIQKRHSDLREVDRPAGNTDVVVVDIHKMEDPGNVLETDKFSDSEVDLDNKLTVKEFKEHLPGMKSGDEKEIDVKYNDDYPDTVFAGAQLKYKCTVKKVKERILPELNDAFAKQTGQAETYLELRMKVREQLTRQKTDERNRDRKSQIITQICQKNEVPIPQALVQEYLDNVIENFKKKYDNVDEADVRKNYEAVGVNTLRWNMLMYHLADQEKIEVLPADTENLISKFAENYKMTPEQAKEAIQKSGQINDLRESVLEDKVVDFLVSKAQINKN